MKSRRPIRWQQARCEYIERPHNVIALGNSGTGKTHIALGLGLAGDERGQLPTQAQQEDFWPPAI